MKRNHWIAIALALLAWPLLGPRCGPGNYGPPAPPPVPLAPVDKSNAPPYMVHRSERLPDGTIAVTETIRLGAYCRDERCRGVGGDYTETQAGTVPTVGRTLAGVGFLREWDVPFGTRMVIDGHEYIREDAMPFCYCDRIDYRDRRTVACTMRIFVASHDEVERFGLRTSTVTAYLPGK